jgi:hypothetical protein
VQAAERKVGVMCDIDFDSGESATVWQNTFVGRARKAHVCDMCEGRIEPGESYLRHFSVFDGSPNNEAQCLRCCTIVAAFRREHRHYYNPSGMRELIVECLQEDSRYGEDDEDELVPMTDSALRWKYALAEMDERREARQAA